jgi:hypothetical protein
MMYIDGPTVRCVHCDYTGLHFFLSSIIRFQNESFSPSFNPGERVDDGTLSPERVIPQHGFIQRSVALL